MKKYIFKKKIRWQLSGVTFQVLQVFQVSHVTNASFRASGEIQCLPYVTVKISFLATLLDLLLHCVWDRVHQQDGVGVQPLQWVQVWYGTLMAKIIHQAEFSVKKYRQRALYVWHIIPFQIYYYNVFTTCDRPLYKNMWKIIIQNHIDNINTSIKIIKEVTILCQIK